MLDETDKLFQIAEAAKIELVPLLKEALSASADRHQLTLEAGSDNFSFGTDAWSFPKHFFKTNLGNGTEFTVIAKGGCVLRHGEYEIRHHRVGDSITDDIFASFPNGAKATVDEVKEQFAFEFIRQDDVYKQHIVLAYMANPTQGLCRAFLAVPDRIENDKITGWGKVVEIYKLEEDFDSLNQDNGANLPNPEVVEEPQVRIVKRQKPKTEQDE